MFHINKSFLHCTLIVFLINQFIKFVIILTSNCQYLDLLQFDATWYKSIIDYGYSLDSSPWNKNLQMLNIVFFPLFPITVNLFHSITTLSTSLSLIIISKIFTFLSIYYFIVMGKLFNKEKSEWLYGFLFILNPYIIYGNVGYSESLFCLLTELFIINYYNNKILSGII